MRDSYLAEKRKQTGLSQKELGIRLGMTPSYAAKRISQIEAGIGKLTAEQVAKAVQVFAEFAVDVSLEELEQNFAERGTNLLELTERLAKTEQSALMCLCYSGDTRISADARVVENMRTALGKNLSCALFVPVSPPPYGGPPDAWQMEGYWKRVWRSAFTLCHEFPNVALYGPNDVMVISPAAMPPFQSRFFLLLEPSGMEFESSLYLMVETVESKYMELIATKEGRGQYDLVVDWEQFFGGILQAWKDDKEKRELPKGTCGYWKRWEAEQLLARSVSPSTSFPVRDGELSDSRSAPEEEGA